MRLSVIIPVWCEEATVSGAVRAARRVADEVIVVDGGSGDGTVSAALEAGATVLGSDEGRGGQLDVGARAARGDVLLFLHSDARLPDGAREGVERAMAAEDVCGGNFLVRFVPRSRWARFFSWANDARRRWLRIYYGDSAIFVRRTTYDALGGFRPFPIMEDYDFVRRLERHGRTAYITELFLEVSARRFVSRPLAVLWRWVLIQGLFSAGVGPARLAALYPDTRE